MHPVVDNFVSAVGGLVSLVERLPSPLPAAPGIGAWDLRALVGHTSRSLVTVADYLRRPVAAIEIDTAADYYAAVAAASFDASAVVRRGVEAGQALGEDAAGAVRRLADDALAGVRTADLEVPIHTVAGGMRGRDYLPTRTFELVAHGLDIAQAADLDWTPPAAALAEAGVLALQIAAAQGRAADALRILTGRDGSDFSVV